MKKSYVMEMYMCTGRMCMADRAPISDMFSIFEGKHPTF
jgi:hypothetical protein